MSAFGSIVGCYEAGIQYKKEEKYLEAARMFYDCIREYEYGELPIYNKTIDKLVDEAYVQYEECKSKLPADLQRMLENEEEPPQTGG